MRPFWIAASALALLATSADAQFGRRRQRTMSTEGNTDYGHQFTFVRIEYTPLAQRGWEPPWAHDYPTAERNFAKILAEVAYVLPYMGGSNILRTDDPTLTDYPVAYLSEPGYWTQTPEEAKGLRNYLLKGGFMIVDDFGGRGDFGGYEWGNFELQMRAALPDVQFLPIPPDHPIFNSFFAIDIVNLDLQSYRGRAEFLGVFEDNDPDQRLMVIVNYQTDIGEFWEYSDTGFIPIDLSNEAYKLGVNYVIYSMMH